MKNYLALLQDIMQRGDSRQGRNAVTKALFSQQLRWDLREGFPIVTTKKVNFRAVVGELLWFLSGSVADTDLRKVMGYSVSKDTIWTANAIDPKWRERAELYGYGPGSLGRIYGQQWRNWRGCSVSPTGDLSIRWVDQVSVVVERIKKDPYDRRLIVSSWNPADLDEMALPACHVMYQFFCGSDNTLSLSMIQRSCDSFLGVPYNISSYALLLAMVAQVTGKVAKELVITFQDVHVYEQHFEQVIGQMQREPKNLPTLLLNPEIDNLFAFRWADIGLRNYESHEAIRAQMIV